MTSRARTQCPPPPALQRRRRSLPWLLTWGCLLPPRTAPFRTNKCCVSTTSIAQNAAGLPACHRQRLRRQRKAHRAGTLQGTYNSLRRDVLPFALVLAVIVEQHLESVRIQVLQSTAGISVNVPCARFFPPQQHSRRSSSTLIKHRKRHTATAKQCLPALLERKVRTPVLLLPQPGITRCFNSVSCCLESCFSWNVNFFGVIREYVLSHTNSAIPWLRNVNCPVTRLS